MTESRVTLAEPARLADRFFLLFLLAAYALAAVFPDPGLLVGGTSLGEVPLFGVRRLPPMLLLALLLWNAALSVPVERLRELARRPALLAAGAGGGARRPIGRSLGMVIVVACIVLVAFFVRRLAADGRKA